MPRHDLDEHAITELLLYANQTGELYDKRLDAVKTMLRLIRMGTYDSTFGIKLWERWMTEAAKSYAKEFAQAKDWNLIFPAAERHEAAHHQEQDELVRIALGEYDWLEAGKKPNPMEPGYSRGTISENIAEMMNTGHMQSQAVAAALNSARKSFKSRHHGEHLPSYLQRKKNTMTLISPKGTKKNFYIVGVKRTGAKESAVYIGRDRVSDEIKKAKPYPTKQSADKELKRLKKLFISWNWFVTGATQ